MSYQPKPIDTTGVNLSADLTELQERLAAHVHDLWALQRMAEGWTTGPERSDQRREHPGLVPYSELSESEREYDRLVSMNTLKAIIALGYEIRPSCAPEGRVDGAPPMVIAPKAVVIRADGAILLLRRTVDSVHWPGEWELPGGKPDAGEPIDVATERETQEETGLTVRCERLVGAAQHSIETLRLLFVAILARPVGPDAPIRLSPEHDQWRWAYPDELGSGGGEIGMVAPQYEAIRDWLSTSRG